MLFNGLEEASDITISSQSTDLTEWVTKYFLLDGVGTYWKKKNARMFGIFLKNLFSSRPVKSPVLFPVQWSGPFWISRTEFLRENYFDSTRMKGTRRISFSRNAIELYEIALKVLQTDSFFSRTIFLVNKLFTFIMCQTKTSLILKIPRNSVAYLLTFNKCVTLF